MNNDYFDQSKDLVDSILKMLVDAIPVSSWDSAELNVEFGGGVITTKAKYTVEGSETSISTNFEFYKVLKEYRNLHSSDEKGDLKSVNFKINADFTFDVNNNY